MTDPELLRLVRHVRNALWVIAACAVIVAIVAAATVVPPLRAILDWFFGSPTRAWRTAAFAIIAAVTLFTTWVLATEPVARDSTPGDAAPAGRD